jgi:redox-sensitive bicupin YhaK (pirin superfamily)
MDTRNTSSQSAAQRAIVHRTRGHGHGPITRLMSPSDLGQALKPFVFLDIFDMGGTGSDMPIHPHSGIATVTVLTRGRLRFDDPSVGSGTLDYGGVEWMRAGGGVWHGKEMSRIDTGRVQGFQLWLALPPELENAHPQSRYIEAHDMPRSGPAHVIVGNYAGVQSPVPAFAGVNYLVVTLAPGESWVYQPPPGHSLAWIAVASGEVVASAPVRAGELAVFEKGEGQLTLNNEREEDAVLVLGSAIAHPHELHLGNYSVHTSAAALAAGEQRIADLHSKMAAAGDRRTGSGTVPVYR